MPLQMFEQGLDLTPRPGGRPTSIMITLDHDLVQMPQIDHDPIADGRSTPRMQTTDRSKLLAVMTVHDFQNLTLRPWLVVGHRMQIKIASEVLEMFVVAHDQGVTSEFRSRPD